MGVAGQRPEQPERQVTVEIDALVLDGFDHRVDPDLVSAAFQRELGRLLRERGLPAGAADRDQRVDALTDLPPLPATTSANRLGAALARAVHAGLSGEGRVTAR
jgi:hypothetical protein